MKSAAWTSLLNDLIGLCIVQYPDTDYFSLVLRAGEIRNANPFVPDPQYCLSVDMCVFVY